MDTALLQFKHPGAPPTIEDVRRMFDLQAHEIDESFGVIATDPDAGLYTALVSVTASPRIEAALAKRPKDAAEGLFVNARVEPFDDPAQ